MSKPEQVKIVECPRDAWQGIHAHIPADVKAQYLQQLADAGFRHIDAVSFVSPAAVPQMADSEEVLRLFQPPTGMEIIGIVANLRGAERAIATGAVQTLGFPYSISSEFLKRNQGQTPDEALDILERIAALAHAACLSLVAYISMAFGNPYGEAWSSSLITAACRRLADLGIHTISLADTVGLASPALIAETVSAVLADDLRVEFGVHLHARPAESPARVAAAYTAGCRRFDSALGGLGGCPFAQDSLVGNIPTEALVATLTSLGASLPALAPLEPLIAASIDITSAVAH